MSELHNAMKWAILQNGDGRTVSEEEAQSVSALIESTSVLPLSKRKNRPAHSPIRKAPKGPRKPRGKPRRREDEEK